MSATLRCDNCGTQNPEHAKFCLNCGTSLQPVCPRCKATLPPGSRFCTECGADLRAPLPPEATP